MGQIKVAVVGTGFGCLTHVRALRAAGVEVSALVGRDRDKTRQRAERFGVPRPCGSLAEALTDDDVTAVTIATPPLTHRSLVLEAVAAGRHVLCEKPFARDGAEAREMRDAAEAAGVVHLLGCEFRWATGQAHMARLVRTGAIGDPRLATFILHIPLLADPGAQVPGWWSDAQSGGGWLGAHAAHVIDQVRTTLGEFEGVSAALPVPRTRGWTAEDGYSVRFRLRSGVEGFMQSTAADWGPILAMTRVVGSAATVWTEGDTVRLAGPDGTRSVDAPADLVTGPPDPPPADLLLTAYDLLHSTGLDMGPWVRMAGTFRDLIEGVGVPDDPAPATFSDGVAAMDVMDAVRRSARSGGWEPVVG